MYEHLSVEELYCLGLEYEQKAHNFSLQANASHGEEKETAREETKTYGNQAMDYFHAAALRGHADSQYKLAMWLDGVWLLHEDGFAWAMKAAEQGHGDACDYISEAYRTGSSVPRDSEKAEYWRKEAIRNRSGAQLEFVKQKVAEDLEGKAKKLGIIGMAMFLFELYFVWHVPFLTAIVAFADMGFFPYLQRKTLRGYPPTALLSMRNYLAKKFHWGIIIVLCVVWMPCGIALALTKIFLAEKMFAREKATGFSWDDPESWDWEKYAE